ncbi:hypothetical protein BDW22DRAFT_1468633 [Trametopsis cervina]|nr:hypothetical protein BDW22DRAFT_1468633 [Trametopsis cervina]
MELSAGQIGPTPTIAHSLQNGHTHPLVPPSHPHSSWMNVPNRLWLAFAPPSTSPRQENASLDLTSNPQNQTPGTHVPDHVKDRRALTVVASRYDPGDHPLRYPLYVAIEEPEHKVTLGTVVRLVNQAGNQVDPPYEVEGVCSFYEGRSGLWATTRTEEYSAKIILIVNDRWLSLGWMASVARWFLPGRRLDVLALPDPAEDSEEE